MDDRDDVFAYLSGRWVVHRLEVSAANFWLFPYREAKQPTSNLDSYGTWRTLRRRLRGRPERAVVESRTRNLARYPSWTALPH
jgi:hypothetical protein